MIATAMELACPATVREALEALGSAEDARVLAGGMILIPLLNLGAAPAPAVLVSLNHVEGLDAVVQHNAVLRIGATARHAAVAQLSARWPHVGLLSAAAASIGDVQVRNRGTIAGSIAQADPSADLIAAAMALGGDVVLRNAEGGRRLPVRDFVVGPNRTALEPGELITAVEVPLRANQGWAYRRISRTRGSAPQVCAAAHRTA